MKDQKFKENIAKNLIIKFFFFKGHLWLSNGIKSPFMRYTAIQTISSQNLNEIEI